MMEINDVIYGVIEVPSDIAAIIRTELFQRLKLIRQVGFMFKFVPNAFHTRYEHCIGTYYRAKQMLDHLELTATFKIPSNYRKAVEVAALLHDVGHGPFSHSWEKVVKDFHHEENALPCVDEIFAVLHPQVLVELRENENDAIDLIKALILGDEDFMSTPLPRKFHFLFEIVNNKQCKLDVDKWDYLKRDHYYLQNVCDPDLDDIDDIFQEARVIPDGSHIEYRYEDFDKIYTLFSARWAFHVNCYRMPETLICDKILKRIVQRFKGSICNRKLAEITAMDMEAFLKLTDDNVLELLKDDEEFKYIDDVCKIAEVDKDYSKEKESPTVEVIREVILGPGEEMPPDDHFHFYGNIHKKKEIDRNKEETILTAYFILADGVRPLT